jgi:hypothetical protein
MKKIEIQDLLEEQASWQIKEEKLGIQKMEYKQQTIDFSLFESKYIKLQQDEPKLLMVNKWETTRAIYDTGEVPAVKFSIIEEDERLVEKYWVVSSKRLISELRPIIERCEKFQNDRFRVRVMRSGIGKATRYSIKEVEAN